MPRAELRDQGHHEPSGLSGVPSNAASFSCSSTRASARSARCFQRASSRACSAITFSRGSRGCGTGPRFFVVLASAHRDHADRCIVITKIGRS